MIIGIIEISDCVHVVSFLLHHRSKKFRLVFGVQQIHNHNCHIAIQIESNN